METIEHMLAPGFTLASAKSFRFSYTAGGSGTNLVYCKNTFLPNGYAMVIMEANVSMFIGQYKQGSGRETSAKFIRAGFFDEPTGESTELISATNFVAGLGANSSWRSMVPASVPTFAEVTRHYYNVQPALPSGTNELLYQHYDKELRIKGNMLVQGAAFDSFGFSVPLAETGEYVELNVAYWVGPISNPLGVP